MRQPQAKAAARWLLPSTDAAAPNAWDAAVRAGAWWARRARDYGRRAQRGRDCAIRARRPVSSDPPPRSPPPGWKPAAGDVRRKPPPRAPTEHPLRRHPGGRARCRWASPARGPSHSLAYLDVRASGPLLSVMEPHATLYAGIAVRFAATRRPLGGGVGRGDSSGCSGPPRALGSCSCSLLVGTSGDSAPPDDGWTTATAARQIGSRTGRRAQCRLGRDAALAAARGPRCSFHRDPARVRGWREDAAP
jgi:hypothetical protein